MAHRDDVGKTIDDLRRVGTGLSLADRRVLGVGKTEHIAAKLHHGSRETQASTCRRLIEQGGKLFSLATFGIFLTVVYDVESKVDNLLKLLLGEIGRVDEMFHDS